VECTLLETLLILRLGGGCCYSCEKAA
jgi:hypothetical protein